MISISYEEIFVLIIYRNAIFLETRGYQKKDGNEYAKYDSVKETSYNLYSVAHCTKTSTIIVIIFGSKGFETKVNQGK